MKKFICVCLLLSVFFMGANSIVAEASLLKRTNTSSSSRSKKSKPTAVKKRVIESQPVELENGMRVVKFSLDLPSDNERNYGFMYSIEWPVSGPEPLTTECRSFIASIINSDNIKIGINKDDTSILNYIDEKYKFYQIIKSEDFPDGEGDFLDYLEVNISADSKKTVVSIFSDTWASYANGVHGEKYDKMFLNNGKTLDFSMLPPKEKMMPLILKYLEEYGEPAENIEEYEDLDYPNELPVIKDGYMEFNYGFWGGQYITSTVPVSEIIPLASPELLEFLE